MRNGARLVLFAGKRFTGTLTRPKVNVPDQKGRGVPCSFSSSSISRLLFVARLGSAFLLLQSPQTFFQHTIERRRLALRFNRVQPWRFALCLLLDEFHYTLAV